MTLASYCSSSVKLLMNCCQVKPCSLTVFGPPGRAHRFRRCRESWWVAWWLASCSSCEALQLATAPDREAQALETMCSCCCCWDDNTTRKTMRPTEPGDRTREVQLNVGWGKAKKHKDEQVAPNSRASTSLPSLFPFEKAEQEQTWKNMGNCW